MSLNSFKYSIASDGISIRQAMRMIDHSGLRVAYIVNSAGKLLGAVSDSEIRKAILQGKDIRDPVKEIVNPDPVVLREQDREDQALIIRAVRRLLERMSDSKYILVVDKTGRPKSIEPWRRLVGKASLRGHRDAGARIALVVGGAGYLGSVLTRRLLMRGMKVRVLDALLFGAESIEELRGHDRFELVEGDMRNISTLTRALAGVDAVINLAAIVGDPACKHRPEIAMETNYLANKVLAEACRFQQINRFIYASTCSVYGAMRGNAGLSEEAPLNPVSLYARSKIHSEEGILSLHDENFSPTILRMGTLYGYSPRMRFDLVVNAMTKSAVVHGRIAVHNGGKQWRPLLHVSDAAQAYARCLEAPLSQVGGQVFNVGSDAQNYQIIQIANIVRRCVPNSRLEVQGRDGDARNYCVSFSKIRHTLGFRAVQGIASSVRVIDQAIRKGDIADVDHPKYYNLESN